MHSPAPVLVLSRSHILSDTTHHEHHRRAFIVAYTSIHNTQNPLSRGQQYNAFFSSPLRRIIPHIVPSFAGTNSLSVENTAPAFRTGCLVVPSFRRSIILSLLRAYTVHARRKNEKFLTTPFFFSTLNSEIRERERQTNLHRTYIIHPRTSSNRMFSQRLSFLLFYFFRILHHRPNEPLFVSRSPLSYPCAKVQKTSSALWLGGRCTSENSAPYDDLVFGMKPIEQRPFTTARARVRIVKAPPHCRFIFPTR